MFLEAEQSHEESVLNTGLKEEEGGDRLTIRGLESPTFVCSIYCPTTRTSVSRMDVMVFTRQGIETAMQTWISACPDQRRPLHTHSSFDISLGAGLSL